MKKILTIAITIMISIVLLAGCSSTQTTMDRINKEGKLVVYTNPEFPPYEFMAGSEIVGVDIEIAKVIAEKLEVDLEIQSADFDGIVTSIASNKGHIAVSGITITEDRQKQVDFSDPYFRSVQYLILPEGSEITNMDDLAGKKIGAAIGYTGSYVVEDELDDGGVLIGTGATLATYNNATDASLDIQNGRIDAVVMDELVAISVVNANTNLKAIKLVYADGTEIGEYYGVAVSKGNEDLVAVINEVIKELKSSGKIEEWVLEFAG